MQRQSQTERQKKKRIFFYSSSLKYFVMRSSYAFFIYHEKQGKVKSQEEKTHYLARQWPPSPSCKWTARSFTIIPTFSSSLSLTKESSQVFLQLLRSLSILYPYSRILFSDKNGGSRREFQEGGVICVLIWLIHVVWQKSTQHCKAIILQLNILKKEWAIEWTHAYVWMNLFAESLTITTVLISYTLIQKKIF